MLGPHHRIHGQFGGGRPAAQDLTDPLILVVLEAQLTKRLGLVGGIGGDGNGIYVCTHGDSLGGAQQSR